MKPDKELLEDIYDILSDTYELKKDEEFPLEIVKEKLEKLSDGDIHPLKKEEKEKEEKAPERAKTPEIIQGAQNTQKNIEHLLSTLSQSNISDTVKGLSGSGEQLGGAIGGKFGKALGTISIFGSSLAGAISILDSWGDSLHKTNMQFAEFSGKMATQKVKEEMFEIQQSRIRGERRADTEASVQEAKRKRETVSSKVKDEFYNEVWGPILERHERGMERIYKWIDGVRHGKEKEVEAERFPEFRAEQARLSKRFDDMVKEIEDKGKPLAIKGDDGTAQSMIEYYGRPKRFR